MISTAAGEGLAFLAADDFVLVADALALVRLRLADGADLGRVLPDRLLVRPADDDRVGVRHLDLDSGRDDHGLLADSRHGSLPFSHQTVQSSSPPSRWARAWRSLMTPLLVLMTLIPRPSSTGLSWVERR